MIVERILVALYLAGCLGIGVFASRRALASNDEYWVSGRRVGTFVNAMAIMASLASGGSIIGVMGLGYAQGIPATLALFTGAIVGFPIATFLVAGQLRRFGKYTITDFLVFRYPHALVRYLVPSLIVIAFSVYIVAQLKAAGITAEVLLGISYETALVLACVVFIAYVSIGGMTAITWTDVIQGTLMLLVVIGAAIAVTARAGSPAELLQRATTSYPELGRVTQHPMSMYLGNFLIWATAISVIPHIVMRVLSAKDAFRAKLSLNVAMVAYSVLILSAVFILVPVGKVDFPGLTDPDRVFLNIMEAEFSPLVRGVAVAAVLAAVMSTTDALLLACSSAIAHDMLGGVTKNLSQQARATVRIGSTWVVGIAALGWALSPPELITQFYTTGVGILSASLFVQTVFGLWWRRANLAGGIGAMLVGAATYIVVQFQIVPLQYAPIVIALPASVAAMIIGGTWGAADPDQMRQHIDDLHTPSSKFRHLLGETS